MNRFSGSRFPKLSCSASAWFLAFFFLSGLLFGMVVCCRHDPVISSWMRVLPLADVSIVGLLLCTFFPFLFSYVSWVLNPAFLFPVCFCRAFLFGLVHLSAFLAWEHGGWLMRWLILFSDCLSLPLLYCFWRRCLSERSVHRCSLSMFAVFFLLIGTVDFYLILPNLGAILSLQKG